MSRIVVVGDRLLLSYYCLPSSTTSPGNFWSSPELVVVTVSFQHSVESTTVRPLFSAAAAIALSRFHCVLRLRSLHAHFLFFTSPTRQPKTPTLPQTRDRTFWYLTIIITTSTITTTSSQRPPHTASAFYSFCNDEQRVRASTADQITTAALLSSGASLFL
jgi:hypothetical protein